MTLEAANIIFNKVHQTCLAKVMSVTLTPSLSFYSVFCSLMKNVFTTAGVKCQKQESTPLLFWTFVTECLIVPQ